MTPTVVGLLHDICEALSPACNRIKGAQNGQRFSEVGFLLMNISYLGISKENIEPVAPEDKYKSNILYRT